MTTAELKAFVQAKFPYVFTEALIKDDVDKLIDLAIRRGLSKVEKIKHIEISSSQTLADAASILKVVPSTHGGKFTVFDFIKGPGGTKTTPKIGWYFTPEKMLILDSETSVYVEYVADPKTLTVEDMEEEFLQWTIKYANALLMEKEGYAGTAAVLTALPFDFNYEEMLTNAQTQIETLETELEEMYYGLFAAKA